MATMRRVLFGITAVLALSASRTVILAEESSLRRASPGEATPHGGVTGITDAEGNPVPRDTSAGETKPFMPKTTFDRQKKGLARGQEWWPFQNAFPPYNDVSKRAELMDEEEILVNGIATVNVRHPLDALSQMPADLLLDTGQLSQHDGFYLIKIRGFSRTQAEVSALESAGAVLGEFININTYIAKIPSADYAAVKSLPFVSYVGDYHPAYKISPFIGLQEIPMEEAYDTVTGAPKPWTFEVVLHKGANIEDVLAELARLGIFPQPEDIVSNDELTVIFARSAPENLPFIAKIAGVKWIDEKAYPHLLASPTSPTVIPMVLQNNGTFTTNTSTGWKLWNEGLDGSKSGTAQIITMMDTGLNTKMEHFSQDTISNGTYGPSHRKVIAYDTVGGGDQCVTAFNNASADGGHGTYTSQHAVGSISNMTSNPDTTHTPTNYYDDGIARGGKVYFQDMGDSAGNVLPPSDLGPSITTAIGKGSFIQNHSWGGAATYDTTAMNLDTALFNNPNFIVTVAAGNGGTGGTSNVTSPATAKNAIVVGGADVTSPSSLYENCGADGISACSSNDVGSSRGPVPTSGRFKPDICTYMAFSALVGGEDMAADRPSAMCQTDATKTVYWDWTNSSGFVGTSFSAPEVAGLAAVVRDYFLSGYYPTGTPTPANAITPAGALVKALILASGEDMATTASPTTTFAISKRYSNDVGYGRANLPGVLHIGSSAPFLWIKNADSLGDGATKTSFYNINGNGVPLRVMLVYYDAAGNALQKDCDLKVTIGSSVYWGNNFSSGWSTTSTTTRDHTNNTEGVFLDSAHGLPASGTVQVDVIGFSNPGGMNYSLVVTGNVASQTVTQISLDKGRYTCSDTIRVTANDASASSPVSVTLTSKNGGGSTIDTKTVTCTGSGGVFTGTIQADSGIVVVNGGTLTATYSTATPAVANVVCQMTVADGGFLIDGGCDNASAGTDDVNGPLFNGGNNEFYNSYMDAGEYSSYTVGFNNQTGVPLTDVYVRVSFSGAGASKMTVLNNLVHVGSVPVDGLAGAVFQVFTDPSTAGLTSVNMDFDISSPADGYTSPRRLTQVQLLQTNDVISRQAQCNTFNTSSLTPWYESVLSCAGSVCVANPWRATLNASNPGTVGAETRTDGACSNATANGSAMVGNSGTNTAATNFAGSGAQTTGADSMLLLNFQPALRGNGPSGQPYHYAWKWHSFYHASEACGNQSGVWTPFYNDQWNSATNPTADQAVGFPITLGSYFFQTVFDFPDGCTMGSWDWEAANTGTPDDPSLPSSSGAPNQLIIGFGGVTGLATTGTYFAYGHEHADIYWFNGQTGHGTHRDIALDNERLVYDEYYAAAQSGASCGGTQLGQVAFDRYIYNECPASVVVLSVADANASSGLTVTVTSPGTGDSETVTLTGTAPYFSGTLAIATNTGRGNNNGVLLILPTEVITATYTDSSPAGSTTAFARLGCTGGDVVYVSNAQVSDNGDNDGRPDNNETVTMDITIKNNLTTPLTNTKVRIFSDTANVDCVTDPQALYGTVAAGATATNPTSDRFTFHVTSSVACSDFQNPPTALFTVVITGDGLNGSSTLQTFNVQLDLDSISGGTYSYSQNFSTNPNWQTGVTPDDDAACTSTTYINEFHWCSVCGNAGGGYGAWNGNSAWGTSGQNYGNFDSSTLYSPVFTAGGNVTLTFDEVSNTEQGGATYYDGAKVQYSLAGGAWTNLNFTTPPQITTVADTTGFCSPLKTGDTAWGGAHNTWTTTNSATVTASNLQTIQFRWRLGSDNVNGGTPYGGFGVDNVVVGGLRQTTSCEPTRNTGLPACPSGCSTGPNGMPCNDGNACTISDVCSSGSCVGTPAAAPPVEVNNSVLVGKTGSVANISWTYGASSFRVYRGLRSGAWSYNQTCFANNVPGPVTDSASPGTGNAYTYLVSRKIACGGESVIGRNSSNVPIPNSSPCP